MFYNFIIGFIEQYENIIIGSVFLGYAIFSYFYKEYLRQKRIKRLNEIWKKINAFKINIKVMARIDSKQFENIKEQDIREHEQIKAQMIGLELKMESGFEFMTIKLNSMDSNVKSILEQTTMTNGRVTKLEGHSAVKFFDFIKNNKFVTGIILVGAYKILTWINIEEIYKKLFTLLF